MQIRSIFKIRTAQDVSRLISIFKVHPDVAQQVFDLMQTLNDKDKKFIIKWVKTNPPQDENGLNLLRAEIKRQTAYTEESKKEEPQIPPEILETIKKTTPIQAFQEWIIKGYNAKTIAEADFLGLKGQLRRFKKLIDRDELTEAEKDINSYKSSGELHELLMKYLDTGEQKSLPPPSTGYEVLENVVESGKRMMLLKITKSEAMKKIASLIDPTPNWCVAKGNNFTLYPNPIYYCFLINERPEVLVHPESGQLKNIHDRPISDPLHAKIIRPYIIKYGLTDIGKVLENYRRNSLYGTIDHEAYEKNIELINKIEQQSGNKAEIDALIQSNPSTFSLLPEKTKPKYLDALAQQIDKIDIYTYNQFDIELLYNYLGLNNDERMQKINKKVVSWLNEKPINFIFYHSRIPDFLKNKETAKVYKEILDKNVAELSKGHIQATSVENWFKDKIEEKYKEGKEIPTEWVDAIAKSIVDVGSVSKAAWGWIKDQFEKKSPNPIIEKAVIKRLVWEGDLSAMKRIPVSPEWVNQAKETIFKSPDVWKNGVIERTKEKGFPPKLFNGFTLKDLNMHGGKSQFFEPIREWIVKSAVPPPFAEQWCKQQLISGPDDELVQAICDCLVENGELPEFAVDWCKNEFTKQEPNLILVDGFLACGRKYKQIPTFAHAWVKQNSKKLIERMNAKKAEEKTPETTQAGISKNKKIMSFASYFNDVIIRKIP